jgi:hypothetical protein
MNNETAVQARREMRAAMEAKDHAALNELLAPDVVLHSPIIRTAFEGREAVSGVYAAIIENFPDHRYTGELEGDGVQMLMAKGTLRGVDVQTAAALRVNADGLIDDVAVIVRPLAGVVAFVAALGPSLAERRGRAQALVMRLVSPALPQIAKLLDLMAPRLLKLRG